MAEITFIVSGQAGPEAAGITRGGLLVPAAPALPGGLRKGQIKSAVRVGAQRGVGGEMSLTAVPGEDVVVLEIADGPALVLHPETARDLMLAQQAPLSRGETGEISVSSETSVRIPERLQWRGLEDAAPSRGAVSTFLGGVALSAVYVVTGLSGDPAVNLLESGVVQCFDGKVDAGVYALAAGELPSLKGSASRLDQVPAAPTAKDELLVLVHGTFSDTPGTFGKLWERHPQDVRTLFGRYGSRVYALDHPTLSASPIANALTLAQALPADARLHLVTHSRGGLVAEVLARLCADPDLAAAEPLFAGEAYAPQLEELKQLAGIVRERRLRVDRIVRVACPARGTLLASGRLDAYLSVLKWSLALAKLPVLPELVDLLSELARRRARPEELPGLAAQIPNSPLVRWLHAAKQPLPGDLRVVAGAMKGGSILSWVKTLLADAFYWTDNDIVVQTRSMYGGAPRSAGASFFLDRSGEVMHFSYFSNDLTAREVVDAVTQETPADFRPVGQQSWAGDSPTGLRALPPLADGKKASERPAVIVVPGFLGSNLKAGGRRIWPDWGTIDGLLELAYTDEPGQIEPDGLIDGVYDDLIESLAGSHEVIPFAYDWRRPIEESARRLATVVEAALDARVANRQPVRLLAHSTGGVVARAMQLESPKVWDRMMWHPTARLLLLGTPNDGLWMPMQVLSGDDTLGGVLGGGLTETVSVRERLAAFPGFLQLQADLYGLAQRATWKALADQDLERLRQERPWHSEPLQLAAYEWGLPSQDVLNRAVALRRRLDAQRDKDLERFRSKLAVVAGLAPSTPDGYEVGSEGLVYLDVVGDGDGRVTRRSALLPGVRAWQVPDCEHGELPRRREAFAAYRELLETGGTALLKPPVEPAATARERSRPARTPGGMPPPESRRALMALDRRELPDTAEPPLQITVVNGDLSFIPEPLLLGHYRALRLTGSERVIDRLIGGTMARSLAVDLYPDAPGTHQLFLNTRTNGDNPLSLPRPEAVIVVGLGQEGELKGAHLAATVRQAVIAWSQRAAETPKGERFDLAATLIGSGGTGIGPGQAALLIAQGVRDANRRLGRLAARRTPWPRVRHLSLVELYHDRACEAWRTLRELADASPGDYRLTPTVKAGNGALPRPLTSGYRGVDYDFISATTDATPDGEGEIVYTLDTRRARSEVRAQALQNRLLRELVIRAANDANGDPQIGRTLFRLLVPIEMEAFFSGTTDLVIELDQGTAGIPWELLDSGGDSGADGGKKPLPWAIRTKLLRKLRTDNFRERPVGAGAEECVLVIGEPQCDPPYPRLPEARAEAAAVADRLRAPNALPADRVRALVGSGDEPGPDARTVINALLERPWRIVHIAGHGAPPAAVQTGAGSTEKPGETPDPSRGVVLSQGTFLSPRELRSMRAVPELVFVNCCYLAALSPDQLLHTPEVAFYDRARFASSVAEELIDMGVRCVVAAGWAVRDKEGREFATAFYGALLRGDRFIDAVTAARKATVDSGNNTWAAYQCYGDPDWRFRSEDADAQLPDKPRVDELGGIASPEGLVLALKTLAVESKYQKAEPALQRARIRRLEEQARLWSHRAADLGSVAEAFAEACKEAKDPENAIAWYQRALADDDGSASLRAAEQLGNLQVRLAWDRVAEAPKGDQGAPPGVLDEARTAICKALEDLARLVAVGRTAERESLCGSACKRLAMVEGEAKNAEAEAQAFKSMRAHYQEAERLARAAGSADFFYPALNLMAAQLIVDAGKPDWTGFDPATVNAVRAALEAKALDDPDFWSAAGSVELKIYLALAGDQLATQRTAIEDELARLHLRVSAPSMWASVRDQARLVLPRYAERAGTKGAEKEKNAADALLERLETLAKTP
jgi:hypothetical protein